MKKLLILLIGIAGWIGVVKAENLTDIVTGLQYIEERPYLKDYLWKGAQSIGYSLYCLEIGDTVMKAGKHAYE